VTVLVSLLLLVSLVILSIKVLLIRQIGVLASRMGPDTETNKPKRTRIERLDFLDGCSRELRASAPTPMLILSIGCHLCARLLADLAKRSVPERLSVGILGAREEIEEMVTRLGRDRALYFDARAFAADLEITSAPLFLVVDASLNVVDRTFVDTLEAVDRLLGKHIRQESNLERIEKN